LRPFEEEEKRMKRQLIHVIALVLTFTLGVIIFHVRLRIPSDGTVRAPLQVTLSKPNSVGYRTLKITNVSDQIVRGYSLGHTCNCRSWDSDDRFYPDGISFTNPIPERQLLLPGESQELVWPVSVADNSPQEGLQVWVDLVHFKNGTNWGPNRSHKEGYVRE
jgi:hypothetical protein